MSDIFCKIIAGEIPAEIIAQDKDWIAINDIRPKAPVHVLVIPRQHITSITKLDTEHTELAGKLLLAVGQIAKAKNIDKTGFRVTINHGQHGGQDVPHLHLHIIGGKQL